MRAHLVSVVAEIDELRHMLGFVRFMGGEYGDDGIGSNAIERVWIAGDDAFKSVFLEMGRPSTLGCTEDSSSRL